MFLVLLRHLSYSVSLSRIWHVSASNHAENYMQVHYKGFQILWQWVQPSMRLPANPNSWYCTPCSSSWPTYQFKHLLSELLPPGSCSRFKSYICNSCTAVLGLTRVHFRLCCMCSSLFQCVFLFLKYEQQKTRFTTIVIFVSRAVRDSFCLCRSYNRRPGNWSDRHFSHSKSVYFKCTLQSFHASVLLYWLGTCWHLDEYL